MGPEEEEGEEREGRSGILLLTSPSTTTPIQRLLFGLVEEPDQISHMHHTQSEFWYPFRYSTMASQAVQPAPLSLALSSESSWPNNFSTYWVGRRSRNTSLFPLAPFPRLNPIDVQ